jgi:hypothetical protein
MAKTIRLTCLLLALALVPALAQAQLSVYQPNTAATGERYHVEFTLGVWNPTPAITISSTSLSALGTQIDAVNDLGFATTKFKEFQLVVRPATKHKVRFGYTPIRYSANAVLTRTVMFHGLTYTVGLPVTSSLTWKAYRFGYEYDFLYRSRWFVGVVGDLKYIDAEASVASAQVNVSASVRQTAPVPTIGGIARAYVAQNVSLTGEVTAFKLPGGATADRQGRVVDYDVYGTVNFNDNAGAQAGYRSMDAMYQVTGDSGSLTLKGWYLRAVVRF